MSAEHVDVSVIIPVRNEARVLADTAATMLAQRYDGTLEFLFVDGESDDESGMILAHLAERDPRVRILNNPVRVEPAALNIGVARARGTYIALLNAHCWFPDDYIATGVKRLAADDATWVTGPAVPTGQGRFGRAVAHALVSPLGAGGSQKWRTEDVTSAEEVELDTGLFAGVVKRSTLLELGPFEEAWVVNHDSEMAGRVLDSGGRIIQLASMAARYHPRGTPRGLWRQYWRFGFYRVRTSQRHPVALRRFHVAAAGLSLTAVAAVAAPRRYARPSRAALSLYGVGVLRAVMTADGVRGPCERVSLAEALAIMHFGWGVGFVCGCARFGVPVRGVVRLMRPARADYRT